jgi:hypothetical protein
MKLMLASYSVFVQKFAHIKSTRVRPVRPIYAFESGCRTHLTAAGGASAAALLYKTFAKLQPMELDSYQAVAAAIERNKNRVLANSGASLEEVRESFRLNGDLLPPKSLGAMLDQLVNKGVLEKRCSEALNSSFWRSNSGGGEAWSKNFSSNNNRAGSGLTMSRSLSLCGG